MITAIQAGWRARPGSSANGSEQGCATRGVGTEALCREERLRVPRSRAPSGPRACAECRNRRCNVFDAMRSLAALSNLSRIGAILAFFGIADTADLLEEHGPRVLALWAQAAAEIDSQPPPSESEHLERYAAAARTAYEAVALPARVGARGWSVIDGGAPGVPG